MADTLPTTGRAAIYRKATHGASAPEELLLASHTLAVAKELVAGWTLPYLCADQPGQASADLFALPAGQENRRPLVLAQIAGNGGSGAVLPRWPLGRVHVQRIRPERDLCDSLPARAERRPMARVSWRRRNAPLAPRRQRAVLYLAGLDHDGGAGEHQPRFSRPARPCPYSIPRWRIPEFAPAR